MGAHTSSRGADVTRHAASAPDSAICIVRREAGRVPERAAPRHGEGALQRRECGRLIAISGELSSCDEFRDAESSE